MIRYQLLLITALLLGLISCNETSSIKKVKEEPTEIVNFIEEDTIFSEIEGSYYFKVVGDFDGDNKLDTLNERFLENGKDAPKRFQKLTYEEQVSTLMSRNVMIRLEGKGFQNLDFEQMAFGFLIVENVGDLDGDGKDELGVAFDVADFSNINSYFIYSHTKNGWIKRMQTMLHEAILPDMEGGFITWQSKKKWTLKYYNMDTGEFIEKDTFLVDLPK